MAPQDCHDVSDPQCVVERDHSSRLHPLRPLLGRERACCCTRCRRWHLPWLRGAPEAGRSRHCGVLTSTSGAFTRRTGCDGHRSGVHAPLSSWLPAHYRSDPADEQHCRAVVSPVVQSACSPAQTRNCRPGTRSGPAGRVCGVAAQAIPRDRGEIASSICSAQRFAPSPLARG